MNNVRLVYENGVPNIQKKLWYADDNSEISLANFEAGDRIYSINDDELYQVEYDTSTEQEYSGEIVSFEADEDDRISSLEVEINPIQDLHGYANPWPAGGGKNKMSYPYGFVTETQNGCTATVASNGTITFSGIPSNTAMFNLKRRDVTSGNYSLFLPEGEYILNGCPSGGSGTTYQMSLTDTNGTMLAVDRSSGASFTVPSGGIYCTVQIAIVSGVSPNSIVFKPMIRPASVTDATFAPYANECPITGWTGCDVSHSGADMSNLTAIPIFWQDSVGTVHGGSLNVTTGALMVTDGSADMGDLKYTRLENSGVYVFRSTIGAILVTDNIQHGLTSIYPFAGTRFIAAMPDKSWMIDANGRFTVRDDSYSDVATFKMAMTGQTFVYELATPQTYQLDPITISTLLGQNNIWANTGDTTVKIVTNNKTLFKLNPHS